MRFLNPSPFILILLFISSGCATKYVLPGNRFISPESVGGGLKVQAEIQQEAAKLATLDVSGGQTNNRLQYSDQTRMGYFFGISLFEQMDFIWYQAASSVSFIGTRIQLIGGSKTSRTAGHKLSITAAIGGNEHEIDSGDPKIEFDMAGQDFSIIHGYRINEYVMFYDTLSLTNISFDGTLKSKDPLFDGLEVNSSVKMMGVYAGIELSYNQLMAKLECGYQSIEAKHTPNRSGVRIGYAFGYNF